MTKLESTCIRPYPLGAHAYKGAVRFSFVSKSENCGVIIYDREMGKRLHKLPFAPEERIGNVYCKCLAGVDAEKISYQFYEDDNIVSDRYARMFAGKAAYGRERRLSNWRAVIPRDEFDWEGDKRPRIPYSECICYCAHVRGFTKHSSSGVKHKGTFRGMVEKLDYLADTGITTVELQPAYEFAELPTEEERRNYLLSAKPAYMSSEADLEMIFPKKCNYWGYKRGYYYAPKAAYASGEDPCTEFKEMIRAFHKKGMEVVMQFYFPKEVGTIEITEILKFWVLEYHVDGFHLMGETINADLIAEEDLLTDTKLWCNYFDIRKIYGGQTPAYCNLASYGNDYLNDMRRYLKGDDGMLDAVLSQMRCIPHGMGRIHYMSTYEGFTMMDMVSYDGKHNEANGEDNRDGNNYNYSWNCGEEGTSRRKKVITLRRKQIKNAMTMLLFSQSTPLIFMGDEFGNSQKGNNNPYCQDNAVSWLDWNDLNKNADIYAFWKEIVRLRREHPILHPEGELKLMDYISCGYPDLSYHGQSAWRPCTDSYNRHIGIMYCGKYARLSRGEEDAFFYLALNMYWNPRELAMPKLPQGMKWQLAVCTENDAMASERRVMDKDVRTSDVGMTENQTGSNEESAIERVISVPGRSCCIYMSVPDGTRKGKKAKSRKK